MDLGNLWFGVELKDNVKDSDVKKIREKILKGLEESIKPVIDASNIKKQIQASLKSEVFNIKIGFNEDELRRKIASTVAKSGANKFSTSDLRAAKAQAILAQSEEKLNALRAQTRQRTANAEAAEERLAAARTRNQAATTRLQQSQQQLNNAMKEGTKSANLLNSTLAAIGGVTALTLLGRQIVKTAGEFEFMETAISSLIGSEKEGLELMGQLKDFARISPLEVKDVTKAAQTLIGFNVELAKVPDMIQRLGDVSMGNTERFNALTLAFAQTTSAARLTGEDLRQYVNAGFNPLQYIAERTGQSMRELKDEMSKGAISVQMVEQAFIDATSAGGKFYKMSEKQAETINGQLSILSDTINRTLDEIGRSNEGIIKGGISITAKLIENYDQIGRIIVGLATTYGVYRTAVLLATAAENGYTIATGLAKIRLLAVAKAQALLNATMLSNPYVLAATALGAIVGTLIAVNDGLTAAERAQRNFNDSMAEARDKQREYNAETEQAISTANDDTAATDTRREALNLLIGRYGDIMQKYIDEKGHLKDILQLKKEIAIIDGNKNVENLNSKAGKYRNAAEAAQLLINGRPLTPAQQKLIAEMKEEYFGANGFWAQAWYNDNDLLDWSKKMAGEYGKKAQREAAINATKRFQDTIAAMSDKQLEVLQKTLKKAKGTKKSVILKSYKELANVTLTQEEIDKLTTYAGGIVESRQTKERNKKSIEEEKKAAEAQLAALTLAEANGKKGAALRKKILGYTKELEAFNPSSSKKSSIKAGESAEKLAGIQLEQAQKIKRAVIDMEFSTRQAEIGAMEKGTEQSVKAIELDHDKRLEAIKREFEDLRNERIKAAKEVFNATPSNKGINFYQSEAYKKAANKSLTDEQRRNYDARIAEANKIYSDSMLKLMEAEKSNMYEYLQLYGSLQQKKLAITQDYNERIAKAQNQWEIALLSAERDKLLSEVNMTELQKSIDWEGVFRDIEKYSIQYLIGLKEKLQAAITSNGVGVEDAKILAEKLAEIENAIAGKTNVFQMLLPALRERKRLTEEAAKAEQVYNTALEKQAEAINKVLSTKSQIKQQLDKVDFRNALGEKITIELEAISEENKEKLLASIDKGSELYRGLLELFKKLAADTANEQGASEGVTHATTRLEAQWNKLRTMRFSLSSAAPWLSGNPLEKLQGISQNAQSLSELVDKIGLGETDFGEAVHGFSEGVNGFNNAVQSLLSGDIVGTVGNILDGIAGFGRMGISIFGNGNVDEMEAEIAKLSEANELLAKSIESLADNIKNSDNTNKQSEEAYRKALAAQKEWEENQRKAINDRASEWSNSGHGFLGLSGKHSFNSYLNDNGASWYGWAAFNKVLKENGYNNRVSSAQELWKLSPEMMQLLRDYAPKAWAELLNTDGESNPSELIEQYIANAGKIDELTSALNEKLTGYSWDAFKSSYVDMLKDLDNTTEDFADKLEEMLTNAILNSLVNEVYKERIKALYQMIANAASEGSEGGTEMTQSELAAIRAANEALSSDLIQARKNLLEAGILKESGSSGTKSLSGSIKSISEQTADLLASYANGMRADLSVIRSNLAAIAIPNGLLDFATPIKELSAQISPQIAQIAQLSLKNTTLAESQVAIQKAILERVQVISEHTAALSRIEQYTQKTSSILKAVAPDGTAIRIK